MVAPRPTEQTNSIVNHRAILEYVDRAYGIYFSITLVVLLWAWEHHEAPFITAGLVGLFIGGNILLSKWVHVSKHPPRIEMVRLYLFNGLIAPALYVTVTGPFAPFWTVYLALCFISGSTTYLMTNRLAPAYAQIVFWVVNYVTVSWFVMNPFNPYKLFMHTSTMILLTALLVKIVETLHTSWEREQLIQAQLLASSKMSSLGEMAGGVAHEINNPLAVIISLAEQIDELAAENQIDPATLREMTGKVIRTSNRIAKIVQGLRTFSRDGSRDQFKAVNVRKLVEETLSFCEERFRQHGLALNVDPFPADLAFEGRATEMSQVLLNLLNNAYDATDGKQNRWIRISVRSLETKIEIRVIDSGAGIPEAAQSKIFQPFFTTKEIGKGTGMGLSISAGIVKGHRGELSVDPTHPNTCFVIHLPKPQGGTQRSLQVA